MKNIKKLGLAVLLGLVTSQASAALLLLSTSPGNFTFITTGTLLPLTGAGATSRTFKTTVANERVAIAYNAECSYATLVQGDWIGVDIIVDGVIVKPSVGVFDAMCTSDGSGSNNWTRPVMNAPYAVPAAGVHTIQIQAHMSGAGTGWLSDSSLMIWN